MALEGMHDIYYRSRAATESQTDSILRHRPALATFIRKFPRRKSVAIVLTDSPDPKKCLSKRPMHLPSDRCHILEFLGWEVKKGPHARESAALQPASATLPTRSVWAGGKAPLKG